MAFIKYIVPALMASATALASSNCTTVTISSQSDADALADCTTLDGDINIATTVANGLTFSGIEQITGSLNAVDVTNLTSLSFPDLGSISQDFTLTSIILLTSLSFPELTSVGSIAFEALPNLQSLTFTNGVSTAGSVSITNTGLTSLTGIELDTVGGFELTSNTALTSVNVNNMKNITGTLIISSNSNKLSIEFPNLVTASNMTFRNTSAISVPSLANLTGELGLFGNYITNFSAPNLTSCADLDFESNADLTSLSLPLLKTISGGLTISENDDLMTIDFPALTTVTGAVDITGDYTNASLPKLTEVKGGFNAESTGNFSCDAFDALDKDGVISGSYTCTQTATPTNLNGSPGSSSTGSSSSSTSSGAAVGSVAIPSAGFTALVGALLSLLM